MGGAFDLAERARARGFLDRLRAGRRALADSGFVDEIAELRRSRDEASREFAELSETDPGGSEASWAAQRLMAAHAEIETRFRRFALSLPAREAPPPASGTMLWSTPPPAATTAPSPAATPTATRMNPARRRRFLVAGGALIAVLAIAGGLGLFFSFFEDDVGGRERAWKEERRAEFLEDTERALADARATGKRARDAADATREAAEDAQSAAQSVFTAGDGRSATRSAERSEKAAKTAIDEAKTAGEAAQEAAEASRSATESATQVRQLARSRLDPSQLVWTLANIPSGPGGREDHARRALEAAEEAHEAATRAERAAAEAKVDAESAHRAALDSKMAAQRFQAGAGTSQMAEAQRRGLEEQQRAMEDARAPQMAQMGQMKMGQKALPDEPVVAILAPGPPVFAAPLEETLGERLRRSGLDVQDPRAVPSVDRLIRSGDPDPEELGRLLAENGFHVLVLAPVDIGEPRTMSVRGQQGSLSLGQVRLNAYLLPADRRIGRGWREAVECTELSAQAKAERALIGATPELVQTIRRDWSGFRDQVATLGGDRP